ncbi:MAG: DUF362 domain-containing protein, partial [Treponema sp.]|nr:DUF362 domain-containing protein [Treponema sp.]
MNNKQFFLMAAVGLSLSVTVSFTACAGRTAAQTVIQNPAVSPEPIEPGQAGPVTVYFTSDISPAGLMAVYEALGQGPDSASISSGKVAVKISTGEPPNSNYLRPALIKDLVQSVNGTIVECNTAYGGRRTSTAVHYQVAKDHGFTAIAPVVIMDEDGDIPLPVTGGKHLKEDYVG